MAERLVPTTTKSRFPGLIITNVAFTGNILGNGADATVHEVDWNGTSAAAKRLHEILLEDQSPGGVAKLICNFEAECLTWSKLRHPGVVQFLGVYLEPKCRLPVLVMEKMETSLRTHLEGHSKEEFSLHQKVFILRQVAQALAYLHSQSPPLVHHDLSPNNVLLNVVSLMTKVSDFGMSRVISPSALSRKSSVKGTVAFMAPEALHDPPRYNEKLDVFSFGNMITFTLIHEWPNPGPPTRYEGNVFVGITELQRREKHLGLFTAQEKQLFLPTVRCCLENRPDKRPPSVMLVQEMRRIESTLPRGSHVAAPIENLHQQLSAKEEECRQKEEALREKDEVIRGKDEMIQSKVEVIAGKDKALWHLDELIRKNDEALREKEEECRQKEEVIREKDDIIRKKDEEIREKDGKIREENNALKKKDIVIRSMQADSQQLRSRSNTISDFRQQSRQSVKVVREQSTTIQTPQAEIQQLVRVQPTALMQKVS